MKNNYLDANIVLDLLDSTRSSYSTSKKVFIIIIEQNLKIFISEDILTTIYYMVKNKNLVLDFFETILDFWEIVPFDSKSISEAITLCKSKLNLDFEDVIQSLTAKKFGCETIISNDKNFYNCGIKIKSGEEFLKDFL